MMSFRQSSDGPGGSLNVANYTYKSICSELLGAWGVPKCYELLVKINILPKICIPLGGGL